jgi:hypothetical protein
LGISVSAWASKFVASFNGASSSDDLKKLKIFCDWKHRVDWFVETNEEHEGERAMHEELTSLKYEFRLNSV